MDRYQRVDKPRPETSINENEIRITTQGKMRNYITYATTLLQDKATSEIVLKAMGRAINKTVTIAEIIKRRIASLHQNTAIGSTDITDVWEPLEEGLLPLETTRHVSMITITLSKKELDVSSTGYQPPLPVDQVKPLADLEYDGEGSPRGGRGRGRGRFRGRGRGNFVASGGYYNGGDVSWNRARGRGRGRGRGFRGRGRGYANNDTQEWGGYEDTGAAERQVGPRGRGYDDSGAVERQVGPRGRGYDDTGAGERQVGPRGRGYDDVGAGDRQLVPRGRGYDDTGAGDRQVGPRARGYDDTGAGDRQVGPRGRGYDDTGAGDRQVGPRGRGRGRGRGRARGRGRGGYRTDGSNLG